MQKTARRLALALSTVLTLLTSCTQRAEPQFVAGQETADLAKNVSGTLVHHQGWDSAAPDKPRIVAVSLPDLKQRVVWQATPPGEEPFVHAVSGPNASGRIAFVVYWHFSRKRYQLRTIKLDGSQEEIIFDSPGSALGDDVIGEYLALSPTGQRVALLGAKLSKVQMPKALLTQGPLQIWDVEQKKSKTLASALNKPMSWFPDGKRLAYVELLPMAEIPEKVWAGLREDRHFGEKSYGSWNRLPVVCILDVETGQRECMAVGSEPVVSADGSSILWSNHGSRYRILNFASGRSEEIRWPGQWGGRGPVALLPGGLVLYPGLPTAGSEPRWLKHGSFQVGSPMGSLKLADFATGKFQTVLPYVDPRDEFSFGVVK